MTAGGSSVGLCLARMAIGWLVLEASLSRGQDWHPPEPVDQPWRVFSLLADSGLSQKNLFDISFRRTSGVGGSYHVWIAASDGLYESDGYSWRRYTQADGLPSNFIRCILVTRQGQVWVGTDQGAGVFDGHSFSTMGSERGLAGPNLRRIYEDPDGTLWFCSDSWPRGEASGGIAYLRNGEWRAYHRSDGLPSEYVVNYFRDSQGRQFAVTLAGLAQRNGDRWVTVITPPADPTMNWSAGCMAESAQQGLLFSIGREVFRWRDGAWHLEPIRDYHEHGICATSDGRILGGRSIDETRHALMEWTPGGWKQVSATYLVPRRYHEVIREAPDGSIWLLGYDCLVRWQRLQSDWEEFGELGLPQLVDAHGGIWFGRLRVENLNTPPTRLRDGVWTRFTDVYDDLAADAAGGVWGWNSREAVYWSGTNETRVLASQAGLESLVKGQLDSQGSFWVVGLDRDRHNAVSFRQNGTWRVRSLPELKGQVVARTICGGSNGIWMLVNPPDETQPQILAEVGLDFISQVAVPRRMVSRFRGGIYADPWNSVWLFGSAGLYRWRRGATEGFLEITNVPAREVFACERRGDELWFACTASTGGKSGLTRWKSEQWTTWERSASTDLSQASDGTLMLGGKDSLSIFPTGPDPAPITLAVPGDTLIRRAAKDHQGRYWLGDIRRTFRFSPDRVPPDTRFSLTQSNLLAGDALRVSALAFERFCPRGHRSDYRFSWRLDQSAWSDFISSNTWEIGTRELASGRHRLEVRAMDAGLDVDPTPSATDFNVYPVPIQSRIWFLPALAGISLALLASVFVAWRAKLRLARHALELESKVRDRTAELQRELVQRKEMAEVLRVTEERFSKAFRSSPTALAIWRLSDHRLIEVNDAFAALSGYSTGELLGRTIAELGLRTGETTEGDAGANEARQKEVDLRDKSGSLRRVLESTERISVAAEPCVLATLVDITERSRAQAALVESEEKFRQLASHISEVFWLTDVERQRMIYVSPGYETIWGRSCQSLYESPRDWINAIHPEDRERVMKLALTDQSSEVFDVQYRVVRPDGSVRWIHDRAFPIRDGSGRIYRVAGLAADTTDRRQLEDVVRQAQKMEAVGTLAGGIAHDFNNILAAIVGYCELMRLELRPGQPALESVQQIRTACDRAKGLIQQILAFSRPEAYSRKVTSLQTITAESIGLLRATLPAGVELHRSVAEDTPPVLADANQIHQVLVNLCTNAWHAMEAEQGRIELDLRRVVLTPQQAAQLPGLRSGVFARLSVSDSGRGMEEEVMRRIFEPFFTTKPPGKGTGLGLSVVHGIMRNHDGAISVESRRGVGTTFHLYFPGVGSLPDLSAPPRVTEPATGRGQRILYLDDEEVLVTLATRILTRLGYAVSGFTSATEAVEAFRGAPRSFDVVVTDMNMPGASGLQVADSLLKIRPDIPVVLSSGYLTDEIQLHAQRIGIRKVLYKPNTMVELGASIHAIVGQLTGSRAGSSTRVGESTATGEPLGRQPQP